MRKRPPKSARLAAKGVEYRPQPPEDDAAKVEARVLRGKTARPRRESDTKPHRFPKVKQNEPPALAYPEPSSIR